MRTGAVQDSNPLLASCRAPDCHGRIPLPRAALLANAAETAECNVCRRSYCACCLEAPHPMRSCAAAKLIEREWEAFLRNVAGDGAGEGADNSEIARTLAQRLVVKDAQQASNAYFARNCKKCPFCSKLVERIEGCDSMVCGRDYHGDKQLGGCGGYFDWSMQPSLQPDDIEPADTIGEQLNFTMPNYDLRFASATAVPTQARCDQCYKQIVGTRFDCVRCASYDPQRQAMTHPSLCWKCMKTNLSADTAEAATVADATWAADAHWRQPYDDRDGMDTRRKAPAHVEHLFQVVQPVEWWVPAPRLVPATLNMGGELTVRGSPASHVHGGYGDHDILDGGGFRALDPIGRLGWVLGRQATNQAVTREPLSAHGAFLECERAACLVLLEVHPDGKILFSETNTPSSACGWLCLSSIAFPVAGTEEPLAEAGDEMVIRHDESLAAATLTPTPHRRPHMPSLVRCGALCAPTGDFELRVSSGAATSSSATTSSSAAAFSSAATASNAATAFNTAASSSAATSPFATTAFNGSSSYGALLTEGVGSGGLRLHVPSTSSSTVLRPTSNITVPAVVLSSQSGSSDGATPRKEAPKLERVILSAALFPAAAPEEALAPALRQPLTLITQRGYRVFSSASETKVSPAHDFNSQLTQLCTHHCIDLACGVSLLLKALRCRDDATAVLHRRCRVATLPRDAHN